jgi:DNA-binding transcriptional regulator YdaS (Cro superfamily)
MLRSSFRKRLERELEIRREKNPRYSLRAFVAFLGTDHSNLSQILRDARRIPAGRIRMWGKKLGMAPEEIAVYIAAQHVPDTATGQRQAQMQHWTAESMAIVTDSTHWHILRLSHAREFQADCRWVAAQIGADVDQVNLALSRLLRLRLLAIAPAGKWKDLTGAGQGTETEFQKRALVRVREMAAADGIKL